MIFQTIAFALFLIKHFLGYSFLPDFDLSLHFRSGLCYTSICVIYSDKKHPITPYPLCLTYLKTGQRDLRVKATFRAHSFILCFKLPPENFQVSSPIDVLCRQGYPYTFTDAYLCSGLPFCVYTCLLQLAGWISTHLPFVHDSWSRLVLQNGKYI